MVSFGVKGGREAASRLMAGLELASIATHVADAKTCVLHPASTTHRQMSDAELAAACERLHGWLDENLEPNPEAGKPDRKGVPQGAWRLKHPRIVTWAFLAWDK